MRSQNHTDTLMYQYKVLPKRYSTIVCGGGWEGLLFIGVIPPTLTHASTRTRLRVWRNTTALSADWTPPSPPLTALEAECFEILVPPGEASERTSESE